MGVQIKGVDALLRKLGKAGAQKTLQPPMQRGLFRFQRRMQEEPPPLSPRQGPVSKRTSKRGRAAFRSGYRRTGTYRRRWTTQITGAGEGLVGKVGNNTRYAPYVGSARWQAKIHQGRWNTDDQVVKEEAPAILADFTREIDRALAS